MSNEKATDSKSENKIMRKELDSPVKRGFAAMDEKKRNQIAKTGGSVSRRNRINHYKFKDIL